MTYFALALQALFLTAKICGIFPYGWVAVFSPIIVLSSLCVLVAVICFIVVLWENN